jgi:hypothetical protein
MMMRPMFMAVAARCRRRSRSGRRAGRKGWRRPRHGDDVAATRVFGLGPICAAQFGNAASA